KLYVLEHKINGLILRGQFCYVAHHIVCFACSVQISSSNTMEQHKLCVNDFSPADPTPDILILHRFREIQLKDQQKQISKLESLIEARDTFDRHAHTDDLTGIANRRRFWSNGREIVKNLNNEQIAVLLILDLNGFKAMNERFGHEAGDEILQQVAQCCANAVGENDVAARLGGDEFAILCSASNMSQIEKTVDRLIAVLSEPLEIDGRLIPVYVSIGATFITSKQSIEDAVRRADLAIHHGRKETRQGLVSWFTHEMQKMQSYRDSLLASVEQAIEDRKITPHFQPIIDLDKNYIHGFEALARWIHPEHGFVSPELFVDVAAEAGCLHKLDMLILESSLDQLHCWDKQGKYFDVHVNLSGTSVLPGLETKVVQMLDARNLSVDRLKLELTETTLLDFNDNTKNVLYNLAEAGISLQLDDFGTGYSSLTHLHDLPIDGIKIDRSFLFNFPNDARNIALIETVLDIALKLDLTVVAEGIETLEQGEWIAANGAHFGQGYYYGKPCPAKDCDIESQNHAYPTLKLAAQ
ncbi:MAG: bifunctional diguanylate cyclase/phosphodiesterase, partial [Granulosicoccus sp.]|nr:bifunctional diguanylate cyclase/phosphodiesterase [Granulosicoccus sp.]